MTNCTRLGKMMAKMGLFFSASLCRRHAATLLYYGIRNGVKGFLKEHSYIFEGTCFFTKCQQKLHINTVHEVQVFYEDHKI